MVLNKTDLLEIVRCYPYIDEYFKNNTARKNLFLATCYQLGAVFEMEDISDECPYGGIIGMGNLCLEGYLGRYKLFRLHAALHDAAGYMKQRFKVGPGYVYAIPFPGNNCLLGHLTGLLFCVYIKAALPSVYASLQI